MTGESSSVSTRGAVTPRVTVQHLTGRQQPFCTLEADMKGLIGFIGFIRDTAILCALLLKRACLRLCGRAT
jgi:hypothetical protein